jgi:transcriptional regulator with XRE-family HTH domain
MPFESLPDTAPTMDFVSLEAGVSEVPRKKETTQSQKEILGARLARLRRERGLTQIELAERLGVVQPVVSDYERGELRLHGQLIVDLTHILRVSADELLGLQEPKEKDAVKNRRLLRRMRELDRLPRRDQQALLRTIDAFLAKAS